MGRRANAPGMREQAVAEIVRLADAGAAEELIAALSEAGADAERRDELTIVVNGGDEDLPTELSFFVQAWARSRPPVEFELQSA
jgi:hypothetical protein